jgi:hypothetical protein
MKYQIPTLILVGTAATTVRSNVKTGGHCNDGTNSPNGSSAGAYEADE